MGIEKLNYGTWNYYQVGTKLELEIWECYDGYARGRVVGTKRWVLRWKFKWKWRRS